MKTPRGFTLLELMVASAIALFAIALVFGTFVSQQRTFEGIDVSRAALDMERDGFIDLEESLRRAGYGMDPRWAFDFTIYQCPGASCRDKTGAPDELVFYARNPSYQWVDFGVGTCVTSGGCFTGKAWHVASLDGTGLTTDVAFTSDVMQGRILLIVCASASNYIMGTVGTVAGNSVSWDLNTAGHYNDALNHDFTPASETCLTTPDASVFMIDRYRYHLAQYPSLTTGYGGNDSYLMLDTGLIDPNTNALIDVPIARNVEDMQVAYIMNTGSATAPDAAGPDGGSNWTIADVPGTAEQPTYDAGGPDYSLSPADPARQTNNAANIRGVRVSLTVRGESTDKTRESSWTGDPRPILENRNGNLDAGPDRFRRFTATTTIYTQNMLSRSMFIF